MVDRFVLVEAAKTVTGRSKPFYFEDHKDEFKEYLNRIIHYKVHTLPPLKKSAFTIEIYQRSCINKALADAGCHDDDIILLSDVDEIPSALKIKEAIDLLQRHEYCVFVQKKYWYYLNSVHTESDDESRRWCGTVSCRYRTFKAYPANEVRLGRCDGTGKQRAAVVEKNSNFAYPHIADGGWHFVSLGGYDAILYKFQNYVHHEYDPTHKTRSEYIRRCIGRSNLHNNKRFIAYCDSQQRKVAQLDRKCSAIYHDQDFPVDAGLPGYLKANKNTYKHFFKFAEPYIDVDVDLDTFSVAYKVKNYFQKGCSRIMERLKRFAGRR